jgi:protein TonB
MNAAHRLGTASGGDSEQRLLRARDLLKRIRDNDAPPRERCAPRIGLPLCFCASLGLHAGLMAMSSVWVTGAEVDARRASALESDETDEMGAIAISLRIRPGGDADGDALGDARVAGGGDVGAHPDDRSALRMTNAGPIETDDGLSADSADKVMPGEALLADDARLAAAVDTIAAGAITAMSASTIATSDPRTSAALTDTMSDPVIADAHGEPSFTPMDDGNVSAALAASRAPDSPLTTATRDTNDPRSTAVTVLPFAPYFLSASSSPLPSVPAANARDGSIAPPSGAIASAHDTGLHSDESPQNAARPTVASNDDHAAPGARTSIDPTMDSAQSGSGARSSAADGNERNDAHGATARSAADGEQSGSSSAGRAGAGPLGPVAVLTFAPRPDYPLSAVRRGEEGRVLCALHVDVSGGVTRVDVLRSSGLALLDRAATDALTKWRFEPARDNGRPVPCRIPHWVTFRLE